MDQECLENPEQFIESNPQEEKRIVGKRASCDSVDSEPTA
jgi:hypothetical protein